MFERTIKVGSKLFDGLSCETLLSEIFNNNELDMVEVGWSLIEEEVQGKDNETVIYNIIDKITDLNRDFTTIYDNYLIPVLRTRLSNKRPVSFHRVIYLIANWTPGRYRDTDYAIEEYLMQIYGCREWTSLPEEIIVGLREYEDGGYFPEKWQDHYDMLEYVEALEEFKDFDKLKKDFGNIDFSDVNTFNILAGLASSSKANQNLDLFLQIVEDTAPSRNGLTRYDKEYKANIINEGFWNEEEIERIKHTFYDVDFDNDYSHQIESRNREEAEYINKMQDKFPLYRHD